MSKEKDQKVVRQFLESYYSDLTSYSDSDQEMDEGYRVIKEMMEYLPDFEYRKDVWFDKDELFPDQPNPFE